MNDILARQQALDPTQSFIVQAPAGSGKTELLTQRFLRLLAVVPKAPEQILAVTFTRKAAAQMRYRIIKALKMAKLNTPVESEHERLTRKLAEKIIEKDEQYQWHIIENPHRLHIVTIDSLCAMLVNKMPVLSQMGVAPRISEFPEELYKQAIQNFLTTTSKEDKWYQDLQQLLLHQDNRINLITDLFLNLLKKRDQWLSYISVINKRTIDIEEMLNEAIERSIRTHLEQLKQAFKPHDLQGLLFVAKAAGKNLLEIETNSLIKRCHSWQNLPNTSLEDLEDWLALAELLLTASGQLRKTVTQQQGFPSPSSTRNKEEKAQREALKEAFKDVIADFAEDEILINCLNELRYLPPSQLPAHQKEILGHLFEVLPILVAHLKMVFQEKGQIDFIELNLRSLEAFDDEQPTDLQLLLDYQLQHILIDEYQDTSMLQYLLFQKLTAEWQNNDGRTLFFVGDPMQSIYRFRGAEVSLFLYTQKYGLGNVNLKSLHLTQNFRSRSDLIDWYNKTFIDIFPKSQDITLGAVSYSQAHSTKDNDAYPAISSLLLSQHSEQSQILISKIQQIQNEFPQETIAILVRARRHLIDLIPLLKKHSIPFIAHEVEQLSNTSPIRDLTALMQAVLDLSDNIAWLAVLRAPWLGLKLEDLLLLKKQNESVLWQSVKNYSRIAELKDDTRARMARFVPIMEHYLVHKERIRFSDYLRALWVVLGGPACYQQPTLLKDVDQFFDLLRNHEIGGIIEDVSSFMTALSQRYTDVKPHNIHEGCVPVEIMTVHKAKGLEFDHVFLPYLESRSKVTQSDWLSWFERTNEANIDLFLATKPPVSMSCPYFQFVQRQITKKADNELSRLLYVAATRAKKQIFLIGCVEVKENEPVKPIKGSFLSLLWDKLEKQVHTNSEAAAPQRTTLNLVRFKSDWQLPTDIYKQFNANQSELSALTQTPPHAGAWEAKIRGTIFHRILQWHSGSLQKEDFNSQLLRDPCNLALMRAGLSDSQLEPAVNSILKAIENMRQCADGQWILSSRHREKRHEWAITQRNLNELNNFIIDFAFVDENNTRWIIDYKLSDISPQNKEQHQEELNQYIMQLNKYQRIISSLEKRDTRCALYFPLTQWLWRL